MKENTFSQNLVLIVKALLYKVTNQKPNLDSKEVDRVFLVSESVKESEVRSNVVSLRCKWKSKLSKSST